MRPKISPRRIFLVVVLIGLSFFLGFVFHATLSGSIQNGLLSPIANIIIPYNQNRVNLSFPFHLTIPKIKVDASIEQVGLTADWSLSAPKDPAKVAWFNLSPRPGDNGSAVIAGHYGWKDGIPAAFDNLHKLVKGDKLYVKDGKGTATVFVVTGVQTYGKNEDASNVFISNDGKAHLNLITCEGIWDKVSKSYSKRLVVFTDKEVVK